jgi:hypothetical protein
MTWLLNIAIAVITQYYIFSVKVRNRVLCARNARDMLQIGPGVTHLSANPLQVSGLLEHWDHTPAKIKLSMRVRFPDVGINHVTRVQLTAPSTKLLFAAKSLGLSL